MSVYLSNDMYLPALPTMVDDFGVNPNQIQLTLSSWFLGSTALQLIIGPLSDRFGRKPILIFGMLLFSLSSFFCAYTDNFNTLIIARFIQGCTVGFVIVAGYASIHEIFNQKEAVRILATMSSVVILAPALGPFLGGLISTALNWRWIFWILFIVGISILIAFIKWMQEPLTPEKRSKINFRILLEQYKAIILNNTFMRFLFCYSIIFGGFIAWLVAGPFIIVEHFQYSPLIFGIVQGLVFLFFILGLQFVKRRLDRYEIFSFIKIGILINISGSVIAIVYTRLLPQSLGGLIIGMSFYSLGFGICSSPLQRLAIEASKEPMGSRMSILSTAMGLLGLLATELISFYYNGETLVLALILLAASLLAVCLYPIRFFSVESA